MELKQIYTQAYTELLKTLHCNLSFTSWVVNWLSAYICYYIARDYTWLIFLNFFMGLANFGMYLCQQYLLTQKPQV